MSEIKNESKTESKNDVNQSEFASTGFAINISADVLARAKKSKW